MINTHVFGILPIRLEHIRLIAAYDTIVLFMKVLDCIRVSSSFAFYVRLIIQTFVDMREFLLILIGFFVCFTFAFYVHDINSAENDIGTLMQFSKNENRFFATFIYSYTTGLGEFEYDHLIDSEDKPSPIIFFLIYTFITTIVILNMLIAIMGETYERVNQQRKMSELSERISIIEETLS